MWESREHPESLNSLWKQFQSLPVKEKIQIIVEVKNPVVFYLFS